MIQFRMTGTNTAAMLSKNNRARQSLGLPNNQVSEHDIGLGLLLSQLVNGLFSTTRSTESMRRGTANEDAAK